MDLGAGRGAARRGRPEHPHPHGRPGPADGPGGPGMVRPGPRPGPHRRGQARRPAHHLHRRPGPADRHRAGPGAVSALPPPGGLPGDPGGHRLGRGPAAVRRASPSHGSGPGGRGRVCVPLQGHLRSRHHAVRHDLRPRAARRGPQPAPRGVRGRTGAGGSGRAAAGRRLPRGHGVRRDARPVRGRCGLPLAGPGGGLPRHVPDPRQRRPPGSRRRAGEGDRPGHGRSARPDP
jgi:hypothetical protein